MNDTEIKDYEIEDIEDLLIIIEDSFGFRFADNELFHVETFGQLCDHIKSKIIYENKTDCTKQQAFYKLRDAIVSELQIDKIDVKPDTLVKELLPRKTRRLKSRLIDKKLGFQIGILSPPDFVTGLLLIMFFVSLIMFAINWRYAIGGLLVSIAGFWISFKLGIEIALDTVGQVAEKMTRENYIKSRRKPETFNKNEIDDVLIDLFSNNLLIDKPKLTRLYE